jgi:hypothetical protein
MPGKTNRLRNKTSLAYGALVGRRRAPPWQGMALPHGHYMVR